MRCCSVRLSQQGRLDNVCSKRDCEIERVSVMGFFEWAVLFLLANISLGLTPLPAEEFDNPDYKTAVAYCFVKSTHAAWLLSGAMVLWSAGLWVFGLFSA